MADNKPDSVLQISLQWQPFIYATYPQVRYQATYLLTLSCSWWGLPIPTHYYVDPCALTTHFHPYWQPCGYKRLFSVALSVNFFKFPCVKPLQVLAGTMLERSPDFPLDELYDTSYDSQAIA